jgi:uncharacterized membrane protein
MNIGGTASGFHVVNPCRISDLVRGLCFRGGAVCGWSRRTDAGSEELPLDIASRRYASGEITKERYEDITRTLNS